MSCEQALGRPKDLRHESVHKPVRSAHMMVSTMVSRPQHTGNLPFSVLLSNQYNALKGRFMERQPLGPAKFGQPVTMEAIERMLTRFNQQQQEQQQQQQQQNQGHYSKIEALVHEFSESFNLRMDMQFVHVDQDLHGLSQKLSRETTCTDTLEQQQHIFQQQEQQQQRQLQQLQEVPQRQQLEEQQRRQQGLNTEVEEATRWKKETAGDVSSQTRVDHLILVSSAMGAQARTEKQQAASAVGGMPETAIEFGVWGIKKKMSCPLQTVHLYLLKHVLGVKKTALSRSVLRECGFEPLQIYRFRAAV